MFYKLLGSVLLATSLFCAEARAEVSPAIENCIMTSVANVLNGSDPALYFNARNSARVILRRGFEQRLVANIDPNQVVLEVESAIVTALIKWVKEKRNRFANVIVTPEQNEPDGKGNQVVTGTIYIPEQFGDLYGGNHSFSSIIKAENGVCVLYTVRIRDFITLQGLLEENDQVKAVLYHYGLIGPTEAGPVAVALAEKM